MSEETHSCQPTANERGDESGNMSREFIDNTPDSEQHSDRQHDARDAAYSHALTLEKLPIEVLHNMFNNFSAPRESSLSYQHSQSFRNVDNWNKRQRAIKSTRLVCRLFNQLASPLLFPYFAIAIDQHSLDLVENVSNQPHLAAGVRGILVTPMLCSQTSASDFEFFKHDVLMMMRSLRDCLELSWMCHDKSDPKHDEIGLAYINLVNIIAALDDPFNVISTKLDGMKEFDQVEDYRTLILDSFAAYKLRYSEQCCLIKDELYIAKLIASLSKMPYLDNVELDKLDDSWKIYPEEILTNQTRLERHISTEILRTAMEDPMEDDTTFISLFSGLPIAAYAAGIRLRHLHIGTFLPPGRLNVLSCGKLETYPKEEAQEKLRVACQSLESLSVQVSVWNEDVEGYATALTASCHLRSVELRTEGGPALFEDIMDDLMVMHNVGNALSSAIMPQLRKLKLYHVSFTQKAFETFCDNLGTEPALHDVTLVEIYLKSGTWASIADRLRDIARKPRESKFVVKLIRLMGENYPASANRDTGACHGPYITTLAEQYIMGYPDVKANPFRGQII